MQYLEIILHAAVWWPGMKWVLSKLNNALQAAAGILVTGQQLWAEACSLGGSHVILGSSGVQQYIAALGHVRFVARSVDAALCCGAASSPSVEAELCRALAQCEDAWQQSLSGTLLKLLHRLRLSCGSEIRRASSHLLAFRKQRPLTSTRKAANQKRSSADTLILGDWTRRFCGC